MAQLTLKVHNLSLAFAGVQALTEVSFDAAPGSITAVIGPNGAGKTSLFNCICARIDRRVGPYGSTARSS